MDKLVGLVEGAPSVRSKDDDDLADRLSSRYTVVILLTFAALVGMNQYVRNPITCWAPVHFTGAHIKFATNYCWVKNTYYLPWVNDLPRPMENKQDIPYYQWIPFILLFQAMLFYLPSLIWHGLNSKAGIDSDSIMQSVHSLSKIQGAVQHKKTLHLLINQFDRFLMTRRKRNITAEVTPPPTKSKKMNLNCGRRATYYLILLFLISKLFYIANIVFQLVILNKILSVKYNTFGFDLISKMVSSEDWTEESYVAFPRVTLCDFLIRGQDLGNVQRYTVQCVLPINLYNEKIYCFLYFWMLFVLVCSVLSFVVWLLRTILSIDRVAFIRNHLIMGHKLSARATYDEETRTCNFTKNYLCQDGAFLCRLIAHNTNNITTTDVICCLWDHWNSTCLNANYIDQPDNNSETIVKTTQPRPLPSSPMEEKPLKA